MPRLRILAVLHPRHGHRYHLHYACMIDGVWRHITIRPLSTPQPEDTHATIVSPCGQHETQTPAPPPLLPPEGIFCAGTPSMRWYILRVRVGNLPLRTRAASPNCREDAVSRTPTPRSAPENTHNLFIDHLTLFVLGQLPLLPSPSILFVALGPSLSSLGRRPSDVVIPCLF